MIRDLSNRVGPERSMAFRERQYALRFAVLIDRLANVPYIRFDLLETVPQLLLVVLRMARVGFETLEFGADRGGVDGQFGVDLLLAIVVFGDVVVEARGDVFHFVVDRRLLAIDLLPDVVVVVLQAFDLLFDFALQTLLIGQEMIDARGDVRSHGRCWRTWIGAVVFCQDRRRTVGRRRRLAQ